MVIRNSRLLHYHTDELTAILLVSVAGVYSKVNTNRISDLSLHNFGENETCIYSYSTYKLYRDDKSKK